MTEICTVVLDQPKDLLNIIKDCLEQSELPSSPRSFTSLSPSTADPQVVEAFNTVYSYLVKDPSKARCTFSYNSPPQATGTIRVVVEGQVAFVERIIPEGPQVVGEVEVSSTEPLDAIELGGWMTIGGGAAGLFGHFMMNSILPTALTTFLLVGGGATCIAGIFILGIGIIWFLGDKIVDGIQWLYDQAVGTVDAVKDIQPAE